MTMIKKKEREGAATLLYSMQIVLKVVIKYHTIICYGELIIGKLTLLTKTTKKKEREQELSYTPWK